MQKKPATKKPRKKPTAQKRGRKSSFTEAIAGAVCSEIAMGSSLRKLARKPGMPALRTLMAWLDKNPEFQQQYARAREVRADSRADRVDDIIDQVETGILDPQAARVMIDALKWQCGHEMPKRYGVKVTQELTGANGAPLHAAPELTPEAQAEMSAAIAAVHASLQIPEGLKPLGG